MHGGRGEGVLYYQYDLASVVLEGGREGREGGTERREGGEGDNNNYCINYSMYVLIPGQRSSPQVLYAMTFDPELKLEFVSWRAGE